MIVVGDNILDVLRQTPLVFLRKCFFGVRCRCDARLEGLSLGSRGRTWPDLADRRHLLVCVSITGTLRVSDARILQPGSLILHISLRALSPQVMLASDNMIDDPDHIRCANTSALLDEMNFGGRIFIRCTIGNVVAGKVPARSAIADVTVLSSFGLGILAEGWLYLAAILDCFSRRIVGWSLSRNIDADLVCDALAMALLQRCPQDDLVHHSDRGVQYVSQKLREKLAQHNVTMSMSRKGDPWDNAMMECFFGSLKTEWIDADYATEEEARMEVFKYIEMFYNPTRRHSALGYLIPAEYERRHEAGQLSMN